MMVIPKERIGSRRVIASVSGGKDSAAMCLWLQEQGIAHDRVFMDTGWEHPATYEYLRGPLTAALGPITEIRAERDGQPEGMVELVRRKGMFPSRVRRYCTQELKVAPMKRYLAALRVRGVECVNATGIRAEESAKRALQPEWEWSDEWECEVWRPVIRWTMAEVVAIHARHGLRPNPLYLQGASRVGCWPCIFARKAELRMLADRDPERVALMARMEFEVEGLARDRAAALGTTLERDGLALRAWFQARTGRDGTPWPITKVIAWARNGDADGDQRELFAAGPEDGGCVRWGLCDTGHEQSEQEPRPPASGEVRRGR
jgi:3'-phosphoadenosine 5'-phosphosulfate sulfotransferase (PAPS reductase)/FAD synthetase